MSVLIEKTLDNDGLVTAFDYRQAPDDSETSRLLDQQAKNLSEFDTAEIDTKNLALAFWTNAYNFSSFIIF